MQYIPRIMKTNVRLHHTIQYNTMECRRFGLSTFRFVDVLACRRFGFSTFWSVDVLVCRRFGLSTFWFVDVSVCQRFGLSTFRFVDVLVCRRFGLSTFRFVDVLTSYHMDYADPDAPPPPPHFLPSSLPPSPTHERIQLTALVKIMSCHRTDSKLSSKSMMT